MCALPLHWEKPEILLLEGPAAVALVPYMRRR